MTLSFFNIYLFGCTRSQLQRSGSLIFSGTWGIFLGSARMILVPWPWIKPRPPALGAHHRSAPIWLLKWYLTFTLKFIQSIMQKYTLLLGEFYRMQSIPQYKYRKKKKFNMHAQLDTTTESPEWIEFKATDNLTGWQDREWIVQQCNHWKAHRYKSWSHTQSVTHQVQF